MYVYAIITQLNYNIVIIFNYLCFMVQAESSWNWIFRRVHCCNKATVLKIHLSIWVSTLYQLLDKLKRLESTCKVCQPLLMSLKEGILKCFGQVKEEPEPIAAAIPLPKSRTSWTTEQSILTAGNTFVCVSIQKSFFDFEIRFVFSLFSRVKSYKIWTDYL